MSEAEKKMLLVVDGHNLLFQMFYGVLEIKSGNEGIKNSLRALRNMALEVEKV